MRRAIHVLMLMTLVFSVSVTAAAAQDASPEASADTGPSLLADLGYPELALTTDGTTLDVPSEIEAGRYHVTLTNTGSDVMADLELYQLPEGVTPDDLLAAFQEEEIPEWFFDIVSNGGLSTAPDGSSEAILDLTPGEWVFNLYTYDEEFTTENNQATTVTVTGEMPTVEDPTAAVVAGMIDFDFQLPDTVPAGPNIWEVVNDGDQPHHTVVVRVPEGTTEEQVIELSASFGGPPASPEAGAAPVASPAAPALGEEDVAEVYWTPMLSTDRAMWVEVDLEPGTYAAICFIPTPDGVPHVMLGMVEIFTVE